VGILLDFQESRRCFYLKPVKDFALFTHRLCGLADFVFIDRKRDASLRIFLVSLCLTCSSSAFSLSVVAAKPLDRRVIQRGQRISAMGLE